jgi:hypothetical protein
MYGVIGKPYKNKNDDDTSTVRNSNGIINNIKSYAGSDYDLNNFKTTGIYAVLNVTNKPSGFNGYLLCMVFTFGSDCLQFGIGNSTTRLYHRRFDYNSKIWSSWIGINFSNI